MTIYEILSLIVAVGSLIVALCGFAAVGISVFFLTRQTKSLALQTESLARQTELLVQSVECDTFASITSNLALTKQIFIDHPELRPCFYSGADIADDNRDYQRALGVAEHLLDFFDGILLKQATHWDKNYWAEYMKDSFASSPILCKYLLKNRGWYTVKLVSLMEEGLCKHPSNAAVGNGTQTPSVGVKESA